MIFSSGYRTLFMSVPFIFVLFYNFLWLFGISPVHKLWKVEKMLLKLKISCWYVSVSVDSNIFSLLLPLHIVHGLSVPIAFSKPNWVYFCTLLVYSWFFWCAFTPHSDCVPECLMTLGYIGTGKRNGTRKRKLTHPILETVYRVSPVFNGYVGWYRLSRGNDPLQSSREAIVAFVCI